MRENASREGCVSKCMLCVVCCAPAAEGRPSLAELLLSRAALAPLPNGATGVHAAHAPPGPGRASLRPARGRLFPVCNPHPFPTGSGRAGGETCDHRLARTPHPLSP